MNKLLAVAGVVIAAGVFAVSGATAPAEPPSQGVQSPAAPDPVNIGEGASAELSPTETRSGWCLKMAGPRPFDHAGVTSAALDRAVLRGDWPRARWQLLAGAKPGRRYPRSINRRLARERLTLELYQAAALGDAAMVRDLIGRGADPNVEIGEELALTPLAWASICNWPDVVRALIDGGADVNARFAFQVSQQRVERSTALIWASQSDSREAMAVLLGAGADVNLRETVLTGRRRAQGRTPLDAAAKSDNVVDLLLAAGADPNIADDDGVTLLMVEAQGGEVARIRQLLDYGADPSRRDVFGQTAEDHAASMGQSQATELLRSYRRGGRRAYPVAPLVGQGDPDFVGWSQVVQSVERQAPCADAMRGPGGRLYPRAARNIVLELRRHGYRNTRFDGKSCIWRVGALAAPGGQTFQIYANSYLFGASGLRAHSRLLVLDANGRYLGQYLVDSLDVWIEGPSVRFAGTRWAGDRLTFARSGPPPHAVVDGSELDFRSPEEPPQGPLNP